MSKKSVVITAVAALAIGVGVGASGSATAEPVVKTVTKEVPVEVVKWKTRTVTDRVKVEVTPQSCVDALDGAIDVHEQSARFTRVSVAWPQLVADALQAGLDMDVNEVERITADVKDMTAKYNEINDDLEAINDRTIPDVEDCLASAR